MISKIGWFIFSQPIMSIFDPIVGYQFEKSSCF